MNHAAHPEGPIRRWSRLLPALTLALLVLHPGGAAAQETTSITTMAISVMPEYDEPRVLVSYRAEMNEDVALPHKLRLRLPGDATVDHACSLKPPNDDHICHQFSVEPDGQYQALTYEVTTHIMYVEFHYGSITGAGQRTLDFSFWPPYPVESLDMFVQEPAQATDFTLTPDPADVVEQSGYRHYSYEFQDIPVEAPVDLRMSYSRPTDEPSAPPQESAAAAQPAGSESSGIPTAVILLLSLAGAAVLGVVLYIALARRLNISLTPAPLPPAATQTPAGAAENLFCRQCGHRLRAGSGFCPGCGQGVGGSQGPEP